MILDGKKRKHCATKAQLRFTAKFQVTHNADQSCKDSNLWWLRSSLVFDLGLNGLVRLGGMRTSLMDLFDMALELVFATEINEMVSAAEHWAFEVFGFDTMLA